MKNQSIIVYGQYHRERCDDSPNMPGPPSPRPSGLFCYNTDLFHNPKIFEPDGLIITHDIRWTCKTAPDIRERMIKERPRRQQRSTKVPLSTERNCSSPGQELGEPNVFGQNRGSRSDVRKEMRTLEDGWIWFASPLPLRLLFRTCTYGLRDINWTKSKRDRVAQRQRSPNKYFHLYNGNSTIRSPANTFTKIDRKRHIRSYPNFIAYTNICIYLALCLLHWVYQKTRACSIATDRITASNRFPTSYLQLGSSQLPPVPSNHQATAKQ